MEKGAAEAESQALWAELAARCVFSTCQTMMNCIDTVEDIGDKLFTVSHFDLVICDEAHRSMYSDCGAFVIEVLLRLFS